MRSTMVNDSLTTQAPSHQVSSSYLAILNRHLVSVLGKEESTRPASHDIAITSEYTIDISLVHNILKQLERSLGRANFGLDIGQNMHPSDYGIFAYAMMNCHSLYDALKTAARHKTILNQRLYASFIENDDLIYYQINTDIQTRDSQILTELDFSTAVEFARRLAGPGPEHSLELSAVHFSHAPLGPLSYYENCFRCPVFFNEAHNRIVIERNELERPVYGANPKILSALEDKIEKVSTRYEAHQSLSERVTMYLSKQLSGELPTAKVAASDFLMSLSLFKKKLKLEGTCYQNIVDEVRFKRCLSRIRQDNASIKEVAFELGFSNASAFNKAFKKWTGQSPTEYRKSVLPHLVN